MPVLNAEEAENVLVLNLDSEPGYSGVENTLYQEDFVIPIWGDAAETVPELAARFRH
ncbi:NAD(P)(+) transhydrogenase (Re/Si-specific) subunit beta, partial [Halarsenatibacter silvermanii]|uniref:proton-translocating NAD(P)(+) transhydrogenase n=1 Tax=Halarsenatibacter silvermanii TaxID=321763 RepID=A0A1G9QRE2_9FIRM|nr:NAD(P) transhydrogenase beta subunit [Halarsenatibacter silvermanii]